MSSPNQITVSQLSRLLGTPSCPVLIDVCIDEDFNADPRLIPTSFRYSYSQIGELSDDLLKHNVVVICQKGLKLSAGAAALLRTRGIDAQNLKGGIFAWRDAGKPLIPYEKLPKRSDPEGSVWVTRQRPELSQITCAWLIRRFIDPNARILFVSPQDVLDVASRFDATPFDVPGAVLSQQDVHCTFDTMIKEFNLRADSLERMSGVVRGACMKQHEKTAESVGFHAASLGLSKMFQDDLLQLDAGLMLCDAFYHWALNAVNEGADPDMKEIAEG